MSRGNKTNHRKTGKIVKCSICDKEIYRKGYLINKFKKSFCSEECQNNYSRLNWRKNLPKKTSEQISRDKRMNLFNYLGEPICKKCGFSDVRALQIDHVNGGGNRLRKESNGHYSLLKEIRKKPNDFQILCANCNWIKRFENNEATGKPKNY